MAQHDYLIPRDFSIIFPKGTNAEALVEMTKSFNIKARLVTGKIISIECENSALDHLSTSSIKAFAEKIHEANGRFVGVGINALNTQPE